MTMFPSVSRSYDRRLQDEFERHIVASVLYLILFPCVDIFYNFTFVIIKYDIGIQTRVYTQYSFVFKVA